MRAVAPGSDELGDADRHGVRRATPLVTPHLGHVDYATFGETDALSPNAVEDTSDLRLGQVEYSAVLTSCGCSSNSRNALYVGQGRRVRRLR
jgi:hypothetical protein